MASASPSIAEHRIQPLPQDFGDELLEEIFFRLPTPGALARASTACPRFRGIVTERSFLRRFSKRHPPPLLGLVDDKGGFQPAQAPHPSAPLARALADAADFTYSFVPKPSDGSSWYPRDVRDGRVLLEGSASGEIITNLAVCDPLSRRYVLLPPIPMDLALAVEEKSRGFKPLLAPTGEADDVTTFKVICLADYQPKLVAFVFSSVTGKWCIAASTSWGSLGSRPQAWQNSRLNEYCGLSCFDYVCGCFTCFSASIWKYKLLVLDTRKMEFRTVNDRTGYHMKLRCLPDHHDGNVMPCQRRPGQSRSLSHIVVGREGALEMFALVGPNGMFDLYHTIQKNNGQSSNEWHLENIIPLPGNGKYDYFTVGAAEGFLFLGATTEDQLDIDEGAAVRLPRTDWDVDYFALDVKTSELTHVCRKKRQYFHQEDVHCYFGFPPSLSKPSI